MEILLSGKALENLKGAPLAEQRIFKNIIRQLASGETSGLQAWGIPGVSIYETAWGGRIVFRKLQGRTIILGIWHSLQSPRSRVSTSALVLAAGKSDYSHQYPLSEMVSALLKGGIDDIIIVTSSRDQEFENKLTDKPVKMVTNLEYERGLSQSIRCGLKMLSPDCGAIFLTLGNRPFIRPELITSLIRNYKIEGKPILVPTFSNEPGHPVVFNPSLVPELMRLRGNTGGRSILRHHRSDMKQLEVDDQSVITRL
ncbi:MAG: nucleotidyltransferase family protein [Dehalococcoidales bacterium]|jgi:molybdenum cofactor cytidylyltransferase|nr:nucleotidyltransferase family protein [Dehalococcoidales bacterium]MDD3264741.1 nucleotidyltransferase family protein [Dehalococcoidales bacterium]MDD4322344.1 nucleotidyltransferase family protein [Dehalococcoidales bacterium]MDD4794330.1 nucleotidyltransferase family protein [Dehalococcoidales bacterium]MDD5498532.1 nucleotidyltransferase family protein [Dehalococcoidales bacterium]